MLFYCVFGCVVCGLLFMFVLFMGGAVVCLLLYSMYALFKLCVFGCYVVMFFFHGCCCGVLLLLCLNMGGYCLPGTKLSVCGCVCVCFFLCVIVFFFVICLLRVFFPVGC